jgi:two-component system, sensor histidine kinase PdtaS
LTIFSFMNLFTPDTSDLQSFEEKGKYLMAWRISFFFTILFFGMIPISLSQPRAVTALYIIIAFVSAILLIYLKLTKKFFVVFLVYTSTGTALVLYSLNFIRNEIHFVDSLWMFIIVVFAFISINRLSGWIFLIINVTGLSYFILFNMNMNITYLEPQSFYSRLTNVIETISVFVVLGYLINQYVLFQNYSKDQLEKLNFNLEQQNEAVLSQNKENITLIKEVHHRVKNNLQIIISLLRMQRSEIESEENKEQFSIAINRVMTMSMIHQKLYQEKEPSHINIIEYINDLASELLSVANRKFELITQSSNEFVGLKTIVPFGLLVNELISNSLKHAYAEDDKAVIRIEIKPKNSHEIIFIYSDNGAWIEQNKDEKNSFGLELIEVLTEQLDGTFTREGSHYTFEINTKEE